MSHPQPFVSVRVVRGSRIRRALVAAGLGAVLLLGAACSGGDASEPAASAAALGDDGVATVANAEAPATVGQPVLVAGAVSDAPAVDSAPALPEWVTRQLEVQANAEPPTLALTYPAEGATVTESYVTFSGQADPGSIVSAGPYETTANASGQWSIGLVLSSGQNVATFTTTSKEGLVTKDSVTVQLKDKDGYQKDKYDKHNKDAANIGFDAWQHYGSCGESVPYDIFKGKASPGTTVTVSSAYGGGSTVAGDGGYWKLKVTFEAAPVGIEFPVTVSDGSSSKTFSFTRTK